ncbi:MAG: hypothetical protein C4541_04660 [Candidatus Auribacter fodinae]|jgi:hypothetical protein|uniref:Uncharacterized protein n=1 Tax=Candidatus Auribacter fodinae TaxID=2093366 RepID=A0A3A4R695_9BACT|nr:MAG: hypothetical protein C4541_04660 [Candidatus Auribacter fodinae]
MQRTSYVRKTATKVKSGKVQKKNRTQFTARNAYFIDRKSPAKGCRHVVTKKDVKLFIDIIPGWDQLCDGIELILLSPGSHDYDGLYEYFYREKTGIIQLAAWDKNLWKTVDDDYFDEHKHVFDLLGVAYEQHKKGWECRFTDNQARAFMLLHVFVHELGHHLDRMRTRNQFSMPGGEFFAEKYANKHLETLWPLYIQTFGDPRF